MEMVQLFPYLITYLFFCGKRIESGKNGIDSFIRDISLISWFRDHHHSTFGILNFDLKSKRFSTSGGDIRESQGWDCWGAVRVVWRKTTIHLRTTNIYRKQRRWSREWSVVLALPLTHPKALGLHFLTNKRTPLDDDTKIQIKSENYCLFYQ